MNQWVNMQTNTREKSRKIQSVTECCRCGKSTVMHISFEHLSGGEVEALGYFQLSDMRYHGRNVVMLNFEDLIQKVNETIYLSYFYISDPLTQIRKALFIYHMQFFQKFLVSTMC